MPSFRVHLLKGTEWLPTFWGHPDSDTVPLKDAKDVRLTIQQAKEGIRKARDKYRDKRYVIVKVRD